MFAIYKDKCFENMLKTGIFEVVSCPNQSKSKVLLYNIPPVGHSVYCAIFLKIVFLSNV